MVNDQKKKDDSTRNVITDKPPRIWPSLAAGFGSLVLLGIVSQTALYFAVSPELAPGQELTDAVKNAWMQENMAAAKGFLSILVPIHLSLIILAFTAAYFSRTPLTKRLSMVCGSTPVWHYMVFILGGIGVSALSGWLLLAWITPAAGDLTLAKAFTQSTGIDGVVHIFYGIVPGFAEEIIFRGFVLTGLLRRWKPGYAIAVSTLLFVLVHPSPYFMAAALFQGIWYCLLLWRTGSVWPAVVCHGAGYILLALLNRWFDAPASGFFSQFTFWPIVIGILGTAVMAVSLRLLFRREVPR